MDIELRRKQLAGQGWENDVYKALVRCGLAVERIDITSASTYAPDFRFMLGGRLWLADAKHDSRSSGQVTVNIDSAKGYVWHGKNEGAFTTVLICGFQVNEMYVLDGVGSHLPLHDPTQWHEGHSMYSLLPYGSGMLLDDWVRVCRDEAS